MYMHDDEEDPNVQWQKEYGVPMDWSIGNADDLMDPARYRFLDLWANMREDGAREVFAFWRACWLYRLFRGARNALIRIVQRDMRCEPTLRDIAALWLLMQLPAIYLWLHRLIVRRDQWKWNYGYMRGGVILRAD